MPLITKSKGFRARLRLDLICPSRCQARILVALQSLQVRANIGSVLVSQLPVFLQRLVDDFFELGRNVRTQSRRRNWRAIQNCFRYHASGLAPEGQSPCQHLVKRHARRKQICTCIHSSPRTCSGDMYAMVPTALPGLRSGHALSFPQFICRQGTVTELSPETSKPSPRFMWC